jgi:transglutaminase-like putative cysteine protease
MTGYRMMPSGRMEKLPGRMHRLIAYFRAGWGRRCSALLWLVICLQLAQILGLLTWNGKYLLDETVEIIRYSLMASAALELLLPAALGGLWRLVLHLILSLPITMRVLEYGFVPVRLDSWKAWEQWWIANAGQLDPFVWFGLAAAAFLWVLLEWARTRGRVIALIVLSIVLYAVVDTFDGTPMLRHAAVTAICGLGLASVRHLADFRKLHPDGWEKLKRQPAAFLLPFAALCAAVVIAGAAAPNARPTLVDPYTLWKSWQGETVTASIGGGTGGPIVSPQTAAPSAQSGYSRDDSVLGGGFLFDYTPVMVVQTPRRSYYRGEVRSFYNGKGWDPAGSEAQPGPVRVVPGQELPADWDVSRSGVEELAQTITLVGEGDYPVLFGAHAIRAVLAAGAGTGANVFDVLSWSGIQQEVRWTGDGKDQPYPRAYTIVSAAPVIDPDGLRQAGTGMPAELAAQYLQLPESLPDRVRELAQQVTEGADNAYDKMKRLESFLRLNYVYNNQPDESKGRGIDFVDDFLFEIREGYCDYFSTAMVVMARSIGVPARWVKGYAAGTLDLGSVEEQALLDTWYDGFSPEELDLAGNYIIRNADAHSWVEVYFEGYGWIPFEPTSNFSLPVIYASDTVVTDPAATPGESGTVQEDAPAASMKRTAWWMWLVPAALALAAGCAAAWIGWRKIGGWIGFRLRFGAGTAERGEEIRHLIVRDFARFLKYSRRKGYPCSEHQTVREMKRAWIDRDDRLAADLERLCALFEQARYGSAPMGREHLEEAMQTIKRLKASMK